VLAMATTAEIVRKLAIIVIHQCGCNLTVASLSCGDVIFSGIGELGSRGEAQQHQLKIS